MATVNYKDPEILEQHPEAPMAEIPYLQACGVLAYDKDLQVYVGIQFDEDATELRQCVVLTDEAIRCFNIWDHFFTKEKLLSEIQTVGFDCFALYGDVAGKEFSDDGETICGVFIK